MSGQLTKAPLLLKALRSLDEVSRTLSLVCFLSLKNHPDPESVAAIEAVLQRARDVLNEAANTKEAE